MSVINYAIEVITNKAISANYAYGFDGTTFRWVTGRPQYDGSTVEPTWEDGSPNTHKWTEGWLLDGEIGNPSRSVDISETGDYGVLSGFDFSLRNDTPAGGASPLWKWVRDNNIHFTNRNINLYLVIDDVFFVIWAGVIQNNPMEEISYKFVCQDSFQKIHKVIPPMVVDRNTFPGSDDDSQGKSIPVSIGNVTYAKLQTINNDPIQEVLVISKPFRIENTQSLAAAAIEYDTHTADNPILKIWTKDKIFAENALQDKFMYVARGGGFADTDILNKIVSNTATDASGYTDLYLESPFEFVDEATFNERYSYDPFSLEDKIFYYPEMSSDNGGCSKTTQGVQEFTDFTEGSWIRYDNVNFTNGGVGCNRLNIRFRIGRVKAMRCKVHKDYLYGDIIGELWMTFQDEHKYNAHYEPISIKRQYGAAQTIFLEFTQVYDAPIELPRTTEVFGFTVGGSNSSTDTWWFSIVTMGGTHLLSNNAISEILTNTGTSSGIPLLYTYNKDKKQMEIIPNNIYNVTIDKTGSSGHPEFNLYSSNLQKDGEVQYLVPIVPRTWSVEVEPDMVYKRPDTQWVITQDGYIIVTPDILVRKFSNIDLRLFGHINIANRRQDQYVTIRYPAYGDYKNKYSYTVKLLFPTEYLNSEIKDMYVCLDTEYTSTPVSPSVTPVPIRLLMFFDVLDAYGNVVYTQEYENEEGEAVAWPTDQIPVESTFKLNCLPGMYYDNGGVKEVGYTNEWRFVGKDATDEDVTLRSMLQLKSELLDMIRDGTSSGIVQIRVIVTSAGADSTGGSNFGLDVKVKEAGFIGIRSTNPTVDEYYCRLKGELVDGSESSNVYTAMRLMLESYDGISSSNIDYTNLPVVRADWTVGRQLTDRRSSFEYIRELAKHSFVAVYPKRNGDRGLKAWREDTDTKKTFTQAEIIRDSIKKWEKTDVTDLYNDFRLWYNWSPAAGNYQDSITLTNTSQYYPVVGGVTAAIAGFPSATAMMDYPDNLRVWKTYVGGVSPSSYQDAEIMWTFAHESYDIAGAVQPLPKSLSELPWYTNTYTFRGIVPPGASKDDSPFKFLENLALWCTLQKDEVRFDVPITTENATLELLDFVQVSDPIFSAGETRVGWITGIEIDPSKGYIRLAILLNPDAIREDLVIRERGKLLNFNKYTESGSQDDTIIDGQGRI